LDQGHPDLSSKKPVMGLTHYRQAWDLGCQPAP